MYEPKFIATADDAEPRRRYWWLGRLQPVGQAIEKLLDGARWWVITRPAQSAVTMATMGLLTAGVLHTVTENGPAPTQAAAADVQPLAPATNPAPATPGDPIPAPSAITGAPTDR